MRQENQKNKRKLAVSVWVTLDGVFDADTMDQWWNPYESAERAKYLVETVSEADALLVGRITYEMLAAYWPNQKDDKNGPASRLNSMPKFVVSQTLEKAVWNNSTIINESAIKAIKKLKKQPGGNILITGSATLVQSLMETDLIDEYRFLVQPILMGSGRRFFKDGMPNTKLRLVESKTLSLGVLTLTYQLDKK
jgi:dihydrofolate reductase